MAKTQRVVFDVDQNLSDCLKLESERTGAPAAELCRRALRLYLRIVVSELQCARANGTQPALFPAGKASE